ncbi:MAG: LytTR family transcriptional regulator, partial [Eubacterium sp.]
MQVDLVALTQKLMESHGQRDLEEVMSYMDKDVLWIGALKGQYVHGRESMRGILSQEQDVLIQSEAIVYELVYNTETLAIVTGQLDAYTKPESGYLLKQNQRLTFVYEKKEDQWKVIHLHVSNEWDVLQENEFFPYTCGRETYLYMQEQVENFRRRSDKLMVHIGKKACFLKNESVLFIEANRHHCIVRQVADRVEIDESITELSIGLPKHFFRVHRSFIINLYYVERLEYGMVYLGQGIEIPIPKQRYGEIKGHIISRLSEIGMWFNEC